MTKVTMISVMIFLGMLLASCEAPPVTAPPRPLTEALPGTPIPILTASGFSSIGHPRLRVPGSISTRERLTWAVPSPSRSS